MSMAMAALRGDESFHRLLAEVNAVTSDRDQQLQLLTERVVLDLIRFQTTSNKSQLQSNLSPFGRIPKRKRSSPNLPQEEQEQATKKRKPITRSSNESSKKKMKGTSTPNPNKSSTFSLDSLPIPKPQDIPTEFKEKIESWNGFAVKFVMHKEIFTTDTTKHHDRLSMPEKQVKHKFLDEYQDLVDRNGTIKVRVIDPSLEGYELGFTKWNSMYAIKSGWHVIPDKNQLRKGDILQVWSFRVNNPQCICFALIKLKVHTRKETCREGIEPPMIKNDEGNRNGVGGGTETGSMHSIEIEPSSMISNKDMKGGTETDSMEAIESSCMLSKKDEGRESISGTSAAAAAAAATADHYVVASLSVTKNEPDLGAKRYLNLKFRNITVARIEMAVPVV